LTLGDLATIESVARLFQKYFLTTELEHIKISLLELKLANRIQRGWGKYADANGSLYSRPEPNEENPYGLRQGDLYNISDPYPRTIVTYRGTYSVEDFNDLHLLPHLQTRIAIDDEHAAVLEALEKLLPQDRKYGEVSGSAAAVLARLDSLVAGESVDESDPALDLPSPILQAIGYSEESPQLVARVKGRHPFAPRKRPRLYAIEGDTAANTPAGVTDFGDLCRGVRVDQLPGSPSRATWQAIRAGVNVFAQSKDDNLWRPAHVRGVHSFMREVYVTYADSTREETVSVNRVLIPDASTGSVVPNSPFDRVDDDDVLRLEDIGVRIR